VDGRCSVKSQPGEGTRIVVKVPLKGATADAENKGTDS